MGSSGGGRRGVDLVNLGIAVILTFVVHRRRASDSGGASGARGARVQDLVPHQFCQACPGKLAAPRPRGEQACASSSDIGSH